MDTVSSTLILLVLPSAFAVSPFVEVPVCLVPVVCEVPNGVPTSCFFSSVQCLSLCICMLLLMEIVVVLSEPSNTPPSSVDEDVKPSESEDDSSEGCKAITSSSRSRRPWFRGCERKRGRLPSSGGREPLMSVVSLMQCMSSAYRAVSSAAASTSSI